MSMYGIFRDKERTQRLGTVMKFVGEPEARRWVAYAANDRKEHFPTLKAASEWLRDLDEAERNDPDQANS